jgi:sec-independent protein translocase protein TatA
MNEWVWVLLIALVVFGGSQLPKIARNFGRAQGELKKGLAEGAKEAAEADRIRAGLDSSAKAADGAKD